jgi:hypothetical protein
MTLEDSEDSHFSLILHKVHNAPQNILAFTLSMSLLFICLKNYLLCYFGFEPSIKISQIHLCFTVKKFVHFCCETFFSFLNLPVFALMLMVFIHTIYKNEIFSDLALSDFINFFVENNDK